MESFANFRNGKYHYIHLPERPTGAPLPNVEVVDMKGVPKGANLSPRTVASISEALARGEQAILFLNRRGFASVVICGECGAAFTCPNCNITYAYHKYEGRLKCHYCDAGIVSPKRCDKCGSVNIRQLGIGTERIEEEIKGYFPKARVARFDRDVTLKAGARPKILADMKKGKIDILIGTQMITKGHDFPNVTLVGVLDADLSLNFPDFRAPERTFQLITQAAGRSGRRDMAGEVIVQTFTPEHYAISAAREHDFVRFYESELPFRRELGYPPFGRVALFKIQGSSEAGVKQFSHALFDALSGFLRATGHRSPATILGPSPAPIAKLRNKYRWQIMVRSADIAGIQKAISQALAFPVPRGIKLSIDMDSVNMM
jgi:primosomal protein N' (replication factor Y)